MNVIRPSLDTEYQEEYVDSQNLHVRMVMKGHQTYEIGPICSRDYAYNLRDLKAAAKAFLKVLPEIPDSTPDYRRLKQALHSQINHTP